jgi:hypothetical protein
LREEGEEGEERERERERGREFLTPTFCFLPSELLNS